MGKDEFVKYIMKFYRLFLEVMEDYFSVVLDIGLFFGVVAFRLAVRFYSISLSLVVNKNVVIVIVVVVKEKVFIGCMYEGVVSIFL